MYWQGSMRNYVLIFSFIRWKRDGQGDKVDKEGKPVLEAVVIQRRDTEQWALPGG